MPPFSAASRLYGTVSLFKRVNRDIFLCGQILTACARVCALRPYKRYNNNTSNGRSSIIREHEIGIPYASDALMKLLNARFEHLQSCRPYFAMARVIISESFDPVTESYTMTLQQYMLYKIIKILNRLIFFCIAYFAVYSFNLLNLFRTVIRIQ